MMASTDETWGPSLRPGPSALPRKQVAQIQRARILAAACEVLVQDGYAGMTVAQVIARAKVSRKTFYDVFTDRQACFLGVFDHGVARTRALVEEACANQSEWRVRVRAGLARLLVFLDEEPGIAKICLVETHSAGAKLLERRLEILRELADVVDLGRTAPGAVRGPPDITAEAVVGAVFIVLQTRLLERTGRPFADLLGPLMSIILLPYLGTRAARRELGSRTVRESSK
jgi:AcrR family transcriptional regulator